jgi:outer membrane protein TolC
MSRQKLAVRFHFGGNQMKRIFLILFALANLIYGQTSEKLVLDIDTAVGMALTKNANISISKMEVKKSENKLREVRSGLFPKLDASVQYQRYIEKPVIFLPAGTPFSPPGQPGILEIGSDNSFIGAVGMSVPIFASGLYDGIGIASLGVELSEVNSKSMEVKTITDVKKAFLNVLIAREYKNVMQQSLQNALENFENVKELNKSGILSNYDLLRAEVGVENLKPLVLQAENNYELAKEGLKITIGINAEQKIDVIGEIDFSDSYQTPSAQDIIDQVMINNPQLNLVNKQLEITNKSISLERSAYIPTLAAFGSYQYQTQANDFKFANYNWVSTFVVGVQLQIPVFNGFKTSARIKQAEIASTQVDEQKKSLIEALKTQAQSVVYRIEQAVKRINGQMKTVQQAEEGYAIAKTRLENGVGTQLEINDAEMALRQAKLNKLQAIYDLKVAEADLQYLLGKK